MDSPQEDSQPSQDSVMTVTQDSRHEVLYFAYGSNMSTAQMRQRCPLSTPVGLGLLEGWTWIINERGYANMVMAEDGAEPGGVYGLLYLLPPPDEERLDAHEGVPWAYEKVACEATWVRDGELRPVDEAVTVLAYVDRQRVAESVPREEYVGRMERAIEDAVGNWGLDEDYANATMRRFWAK